MGDKVTIVVPAYNAEQFLGENIESIIKQSYQNLEIIYVCDGCTDHTVQILKEYAQRDTRIIVEVQSQNQGAGAARNLGMDMASGDWIIFLDADDLFDSHMIEEMLKAAVVTGADIACCYWECFDIAPDEHALLHNELRKCYCKTYPIVETANELSHIIQLIDTAPWCKLVSKSIYKEEDVKFQLIPNTEDVYYSVISVLNSKKIVYVNKNYVHYRSRKGRHTLSAESRQKKSYIWEAHDEVFDYINKQQNKQELLKSFYNSVISVLWEYLDQEVYMNLIKDLIQIYLKKWNMQDVFLQLSCINRILYHELMNGGNEKDKQILIMRAKLEFVKSLSHKGCSVWGTGCEGRKLLKAISDVGIKIQHVFDSSSDMWGKEVSGFFVENFDNIQAENIIISTSKYYEEIRQIIGKRAENIYNLDQQICMIPCEGMIINEV